MTFFLDSGLEIRVPNDQFMTPFVDINREGRRVVDNSKREFLMNPLSNQPATLGRYFLTAAYLMVNHDSNSFTLWQANPTTSTDLVPVHDEEAAKECRGDVPGLVQPSASATASPSASPTNDAQNDHDQTKEDRGATSISPAVIGGAAGGGAAALVLAGVVAFIIIHRRRKKRATTAGTIASKSNAPPPQYDYKYKLPYDHTLQWSAQEVAGSEPGSHEVAGSEGQQYVELDTGDYSRRI